MKRDEVQTPTQKSGMKATSLRALLAFSLAVVIVGSVAIYYIGFSELRTYSIEVGHRVVDANASTEQIKNLQAPKSQLDKEKGLIAKANDIFATETTYQPAAIRDIQRYADLAGISIATTFDGDIPLQNSRSFSVTVRSDVTYGDFIAFLRGVESNIPKLQVTHVSIGRADAGGELVAIERLVISIFVR